MLESIFGLWGSLFRNDLEEKSQSLKVLAKCESCNTCRHLQQIVDTLESNRLELEKQTSALNAKLGLVHESLLNAQTESKSIEAAKIRLEQLTAEAEQAEERIENANQCLDKQKPDVECLQREKLTVMGVLSRLREEVQEATEQKESLQLAVGLLEGRSEELKELVNKLKTQKETLQKETTTTTSKLNETRTKLTQLETKAEALKKTEQERQTTDKRVAVLKNQKEGLEKDFKQLEKDKKESETTLKSLRSQEETLRSSVALLEERSSRIQLEIDEMQPEHDRLNEIVRERLNEEATLENIQSELESAQQAYDMLSSKIEAATKHLDCLKKTTLQVESRMDLRDKSFQKTVLADWRSKLALAGQTKLPYVSKASPSLDADEPGMFETPRASRVSTADSGDAPAPGDPMLPLIDIDDSANSEIFS
eukprot:Protomagalhaensia_wolfi_Nauph_80__945@NODE_1545_length_1478_cov_7_804031_g1199_i0_p1_GENE_NODE_1545_length_1478_cov_7_804031_g1199_i0NODE_1545_length_1478_cov_7_804031_g1199_i0_p1_ORF_typecomplete_len445_score98_49Spc7/PF08317_11/0_00089Spc7/PF08317_11/0_03Spc7/PF08317_11/0_053Myosin_tail_1/PF01576_19/8_9e05HOOK/PF05622_12/0_00082Filament/PF00038_21/6_9Filament/PF00038_21/0_28Filament/PF00038_21/75Filament/PF00038_21/0_00033DBP/PF12361_8/9_2e05KASH_CCD/PF14662_6/73KASH_CCD/PF14662_6/0_0073KASH_C